MARMADIDVIIRDLEAMKTMFDATSIDGMIKGLEKNATEGNFVNMPCKVGDTVWCIQPRNEVRPILPGKVTEIYFVDDMKMGIVCKRICRGEWGRNIFATEAEARAALERWRNNG